LPQRIIEIPFDVELEQRSLKCKAVRKDFPEALGAALLNSTFSANEINTPIYSGQPSKRITTSKNVPIWARPSGAVVKSSTSTPVNPK
jgi:hypothetical protein